MTYLYRTKNAQFQLKIHVQSIGRKTNIVIS